MYLDELAFQADRLELDTLILHVNIQVAVACADGAVAFNDPALKVVQRGREGNAVADELAVAGGVVLQDGLLVLGLLANLRGIKIDRASRKDV